MRYLFLFLFLHILISHFLFFRSPLFFSFASSLDILCNSFFVLSLSYIFISLCHFSSLPPDIFFFFYFGYLPLLFFFHFQSIPYFIFSFFASYFIIKAFLIPKFSFIHIFFFHSFVHWFPFFSRLIFSTCLLFFFIFLIFFSLHSLFFYFLLPAFFVYFLLLFILSSLLPTSFLSLAFMYSAVSAYLTSLSFSLSPFSSPSFPTLLFYFPSISPLSSQVNAGFWSCHSVLSEDAFELMRNWAVACACTQAQVRLPELKSALLLMSVYVCVFEWTAISDTCCMTLRIKQSHQRQPWDIDIRHLLICAVL